MFHGVKLTDNPDHHPFCCLGCRTSQAPFVDFQIEVGIDWLYFCLDCVSTIIRGAGGGSMQDLEALKEQIENAEKRVEDLLLERTDLHDQLQRADELRRAVAFTIEHGAVYDPRTKKLKPRPVPGIRSPDWAEPLVAVEEQPSD
jgi:hypothetical protein